MFARRQMQMGEKYVVHENYVFYAFLNLEKAYDRIDRHAMWQMLRMHESELKCG